MKKNTVVIAGAGSTHTPGIIQSLLQKKEEFPLKKLILFDIDEERMNIMKKLGYKAISVVDALGSSGSVKTNIYEAITKNEQFGKIKGPDGLKNRYFTEDIPFGLVGWSVIAKLTGVETPIMDALITIGSISMGQDCRKTGRTVEELGLSGMNIEQLKTYLYEG